MDKKFRSKLIDLTFQQLKEGAVGEDEIGFARRLDTPEEAVKTILKNIPDAVRQKLSGK